MTISDNAADLLKGANAAGEKLATSVTLTGTSNSVNAANAEILAGLNGFTLRAGATLNIADNAVDLLGASSDVFGLATSVTLKGSNSVTAANAEALADLNAFRLGAGATLNISDSAADLLNPDYSAGLAKATSVTLTGTNAITVAAARTLLAKKLSLAPGAELTLADTGSNLSGVSASMLTSLGKLGVREVVDLDASGSLTFSAAQTAALELVDEFVTAPNAGSSGVTVKEVFSNGGVDVLTFNASGATDSLDASSSATAAYASASGLESTSGSLTLSANSLNVRESASGLSVTRGSDVSWVEALVAGSSETITATGETSDSSPSRRASARRRLPVSTPKPIRSI